MKKRMFICVVVIFALSLSLAGCNKNKDDNSSQAGGFVWPYTGLKTAKSEENENTKMRPICVKVENTRPARPQSGINSADVIYETMTEGGETRLNAIFQSKLPKKVGPIRSARLSDAWIVPQYDGMLFYSGAHESVRSKLAEVDVTNMNVDVAQPIYWRSDDRTNLYNLYADLSKSYEIAEQKNYETSSDNVKGFDFSNSETSNGESINSVGIPFSTISDVRWEWSDDSFQRYMDNSEHLTKEGEGAEGESGDSQTEEIITAKNIVVMSAEYIQQDRTDSAGSPTFDINLGGSGEATIFTNGKAYHGTWEADGNTPPSFVDADGNEIPLTPGNTWIEVVKPELELDIENSTGE